MSMATATVFATWSNTWPQSDSPRDFEFTFIVSGEPFDGYLILLDVYCNASPRCYRNASAGRCNVSYGCYRNAIH